MIACDVPKYLWCEAINHAIYIHNKSFTHAIKGKTPEEGFTLTFCKSSHYNQTHDITNTCYHQHPCKPAAKSLLEPTQTLYLKPDIIILHIPNEPSTPQH